MVFLVRFDRIRDRLVVELHSSAVCHRDFEASTSREDVGIQLVARLHFVGPDNGKLALAESVKWPSYYLLSSWRAASVLIRPPAKRMANERLAWR